MTKYIVKPTVNDSLIFYTLTNVTRQFLTPSRAPVPSRVRTPRSTCLIRLKKSE